MRVVIIGNGVAGITAARHLRKLSDYEIIVVSDEAPYHFSRPAMMYVSMGHMTFTHTQPYEDWFWKENNIELIHDQVLSVQSSGLGGYRIELSKGATVNADKVILATGSVAAWYGWPGTHALGVQAYVSKQDLDALDGHIKGAKTAVVVGGGLIGVEAAEVLSSRGISVTMLVREIGFYRNVFPKEEADIISRHVTSHGVDLRLETELDRIEPGQNSDRVSQVVTTNGEQIPANIVVLATGVKPRIDLAQKIGLSVARGILVNGQFKTSAPNIYAIGDCAEFENGLEQLWYTARAHGEHVARVIALGAGAYQRGTYFNSAKFFDLEWQVYGSVPPDSNSSTSVFWHDTKLERCIRIAHSNGTVCGIHGIGVRLRQALCVKWIEEGASIEVVSKQFQSAVFDPEFSAKVSL